VNHNKHKSKTQNTISRLIALITIMTNEQQDINTLKKYIESCPASILSKDSKAIQICIHALDAEMKRLIRDEKLKKKFSSDTANVADDNGTSNGNPLSDTSMEEHDMVQVEITDVSTIPTSGVNNNTAKTEETAMGDTDWETVEEQERSESGTMATSSSSLGEKLCQVALSDMSNAGTTVRSPLAAVALVLHSAIRSTLLGFKCTGIPDMDSSSKKNNNAFAAPVRELPKGVFVPQGWDKYDSTRGIIALRYRKDGMPSMILNVSLDDSTKSMETSTSSVDIVSVKFGPIDTDEPVEIQFPLEQHVNVHGLNTALHNTNGVKPSLFYKSLVVLLTEFCLRADLGSVKEDGSSGQTLDEIAMKYTMGIPIPAKVPTFQVHESKQKEQEWKQLQSLKTYPRHGPTIEDDLLGNRIHTGTGDFSDDLLPTGFPAPGFADPRLGPREGMTGNLMGPHHPAFHRQFGPDNGDDDTTNDDDMILPGGLGMRPRFDPVYPPGVRGRGRGRGRSGRGSNGRFGDPDPDHQRPPNSFGDNMFM
jgi:hypothetical protein